MAEPSLFDSSSRISPRTRAVSNRHSRMTGARPGRRTGSRATPASGTPRDPEGLPGLDGRPGQLADGPADPGFVDARGLERSRGARTRSMARRRGRSSHGPRKDPLPALLTPIATRVIGGCTPLPDGVRACGRRRGLLAILTQRRSWRTPAIANVQAGRPWPPSRPSPGMEVSALRGVAPPARGAPLEGRVGWRRSAGDHLGATGCLVPALGLRRSGRALCRRDAHRRGRASRWDAGLRSGLRPG